jgi:hypothetical protein
MNEVDDFRATTLARQAEAEAAFHQGDPGPRIEMWSRRDPVTCLERQHVQIRVDELSRIFPLVASRFSNVSDTVRATHVYRREDGEWKIVHRHGDNPPPEQSPPMPAR